MKKAAAYAEKEGENVEYIYCSSDPDSLDGVIIHGKETGILDGTSPHTSDTLYPGAYDEIVNTGEFWNTDTLISNKDEITHLSDLKKELYNRAYLYLNAALSCETLAHGISSSAINKEKLDRAVCRLLKQIEPSVKGERKIRLTEGITMKGYVNLHSYKCCKNIYTINDTYNIGCEYLSAIDKLLTQKGIGHTVSYSPLDTTKLNLIHIEENDTLFVPYKYENTKKYINTERFINKSYINKNEINRA
ncbi:MAG: hypothetical protein IKU52_03640, partial [Clostridia bacterium]|nr:hypothetical protein [Clostridia bacterium]